MTGASTLSDSALAGSIQLAVLVLENQIRPSRPRAVEPPNGMPPPRELG